MLNVKLHVLFASALLVFAAASSFAAASEATLKPWHQQLECVACHADAPNAAPQSSACISCHESADAVAKRTERLNKRGINPHDNYHYGKTMDCLACHREHQPSYDACNECHDFSRWMKPTP